MTLRDPLSFRVGSLPLLISIPHAAPGSRRRWRPA